MKTLPTLALWMLCAGGAIAVQATAAPPPAASAPPAAAKDIRVDAAPAPAAPPTRPAEQALLAQSLGDLGMQLLRTALPSGNAVVAPYSVASALGLLQVGARGATAREIDTLLVPAVRTDPLLRTRMGELRTALAAGDTPAVLASANRVWLDARIAATIQPDYAAAAQQVYGSGAALVSFGTPEAVAQINAWVAEQTRGGVPALLAPGALDASTRLVATNAVHFKALWATPFAVADTAAADFTLGDGQKVPVPTMRRTLRAPLFDAGLARVLVLDYAQGDAAMAIVLPRADSSLAEVAGLMHGSAWWQALQGARPTLVELALPRFALKPAAFDAAGTLQALGVRTAFGGGADFSGLTGARDLSLSKLIHAAAVTVDEQGTEASAATAATARVKSIDIATPTPFVVDRPFLFAIFHRPTGTPLFVGRVVDPRP